MRYKGHIVRPPSESASYTLQVTFGCSYNGCEHCDINLADKTFEIRPMEQVLEDIDMAKHIRSQTQRVFLADGNALVLSTERLTQILDALDEAFHLLERVGTYASADDVLNKSEEALHLLKSKKLGIVYLCFGSGSDKVLEHINVDITVEKIIAAAEKAQKVGLQVALTAVLGLGGEEFSKEHIEKTAKVINQINPDLLTILTLTLVRGSELHQKWLSGEFELLYPGQTLFELKQLIELLDENIQFEVNATHASNYIKLQGNMPQDRDNFIAKIDTLLAEGDIKNKPQRWKPSSGGTIPSKQPI